ncbi:MAG: group III truncated hemoglobin [Gammaproteobacteria bacterium]|nr:group III truncated hemoglobin [Gammaproteobacteria bacterium]
MTTTADNTPITTEQIDTIVRVFYAKIRVHPTLGPIFNGALGTNTDIWDFHEDKINRFWRNVLFREGNYGVNLMATHMEVPNIKDEHFTQWLALFDTVLHDLLPEETALLFSAKAHKIGSGLRRSVGLANGLSEDEIDTE